MEAAEVVRELESDARLGLAPETAAARLQEHGYNELQESGGRGPWAILWEQVSGAMVVMLLIAAAVSLALGEYTDAVAILVIVLLNAALKREKLGEVDPKAKFAPPPKPE